MILEGMNRILSTAAVLSATVAVAVAAAREMAQIQVWAAQECATDCEMTGPAALPAEIALVVGGVIAATLVFTLLARIGGGRGERV